MNSEINYAILNTRSRHGTRQAANAIYSLMIGAGANRFSRNGRDGILRIPSNRIYQEIFKNYVEVLANNVPKNPNEFEYAVLMTYQKIKNLYEKNGGKEKPEDIMADSLVEYVINGKQEAFTRDNNARDGIKKLESDLKKSGFNSQQFVLSDVSNFLSENVTIKDIKLQKNNNIKHSRVKVKENYLPKFAEQVLDQKMIPQTGEFFNPINVAKIGKSLQAAQNIGKSKRYLDNRKQDDAVLIMQNADNPKYKMMVIADGMGGSDKGSLASRYIIDQMKEWYKNLGNYDTSDPKLAKAMEAKVEQMSNEIYEKYNLNNKNSTGSTFLGALIDDKGVIVSSVGDSKAFITKDSQLFEVDNMKSKQLNKVSSIHSLSDEVYILDYAGKVNKEDMRFFKKNNVVLEHMGQEDKVNVNSWRLDSKDYDRLIIGSDGVSDCLSLDEISTINKGVKPELVSEYLVRSAISGAPSLLPEYIKNNPDLVKDFNLKIRKGKDNTSAAVYDKTLDNDRDGR